MSRRGLALVVALAAVFGLGACGDPASEADQGAASKSPTRSSPSPVPAGFVGMAASEALPQPPAEQQATLKAQAAAGVETFRQTFQWNEIEPSKGQFVFGPHDQLVASAAKAGIQVLPLVFNVRPGEGAAPKPRVKVTESTTMPPRDPAAFADFAEVLVKRYGRGGTFWAEHPELPPHPMTAWQIWNEPNLPAYWGGRPNEKEYVALLRASAAAIRGVDPKAEIVSAGLPESKLGIPLEDYVHLLAKAGAKGTFDTLAIHPYASNADGVLLGTEMARALLDRNGFGDVKLWITEFGWATGGPHSAYTVSERRQGELLTELLVRAAAIAPDLKLRGIVYFGWRDVRPYLDRPDFWGNHTGLLTIGGKPKPALADFSAAARGLRAGS